jgi:hypothetical protein
MLYFIQAKVVRRVFGISGAFEDVITKLVTARSTAEAKARYEEHVRMLFSNMNADSFDFEYIIIADTI